MSRRAIAHARELIMAVGPDLTQLDRAVLRHLAYRYRDDRGYAWPDVDRVAASVGASPGSVRRSVRWLKERGVLTVTRTGRASLYHLAGLDGVAALPATGDPVARAVRWYTAGDGQNSPRADGRNDRRERAAKRAAARSDRAAPRDQTARSARSERAAPQAFPLVIGAAGVQTPYQEPKTSSTARASVHAFPCLCPECLTAIEAKIHAPRAG